MLNSNKERWYDQDPLLKQILLFLESATPFVRYNITMDLMQIIIQENYIPADELMDFLKNNYSGTNKRWYDQNEVSYCAIEMLKLLQDNERKIVLEELINSISYFINEAGNNDERLDSWNRYLSNKQD